MLKQRSHRKISEAPSWLNNEFLNYLIMKKKSIENRSQTIKSVNIKKYFF